MNRRDFMKTSSAAAMAWSWGATAAPSETPLFATSIHPLGKSGIQTTFLGFGTGTRAGGGDSEQIRQGKELFVKTLIHGYEQGIRYFDLADSYGSHEYLRKAKAEGNMDRTKMTLLTKTRSKDAEGVKADLDRFRKEIDSDYIDIVLMHCMTEKRWPDKMAPCMEVLAEAKEKGIIKACGVSCHDIRALEMAAENDWVDIMLSRINPYGVLMDGTADEVVPILKKAHKNGKGMLGMKIVGEGRIKDRLDESLKFVMGLGCIDAVTIGFLNPGEVDNMVARIQQQVKT